MGYEQTADRTEGKVGREEIRTEQRENKSRGNGKGRKETEKSEAKETMDSKEGRTKREHTTERNRQ